MAHITDIAFSEDGRPIASIGFGVQSDVVDLIFPFISFDRMLSWERAAELYEWFKKHALELEILESIREQGEYKYKYDLLVQVARTTDCDWINNQAFDLLKEREKAQQFAGQRSNIKAAEDRSGYVYVVEADNGLYKIGLSKEPRKRIDALGVKLPYELEIIILIETPDRYELERELHEQFADKRKNGEWFELTSKDLETINATYACNN